MGRFALVFFVAVMLPGCAAPTGSATPAARAPGGPVGEPSPSAAGQQGTNKASASQENDAAGGASSDGKAAGSDDEAAAPPPGWLGVQLEAMPPGAAGVLIKLVTRGSPAEAAGIRANDVVLKLNGQAVVDWRSLKQEVAKTGAGGRALFVLDRGGEIRLIAVTLAQPPTRERLVRAHLGDRPAPRFEKLAPVSGSLDLSASNLRGKVVIVDFWAAWCLPCRAVVPVLNDWYARYHAQGLEVVSVTMDPVTSAAQDVRNLGVSYPVFSDVEGKTSRAYLATTLPTLFLLDRRGVVRHAIVGIGEQRFADFESKLHELLDER